MRRVVTIESSACSRLAPAARRSAAGLLIALALAGCGEGSAAGGGEAGFVAQADAICAEANEKEVDLGAPGSGWMYGERYDDVGFLEPFNDVGRAALRKLEDLTPPAGDREAAATMLGALGRMVEALDSRIATLRDGREETRALQIYESSYSDLVTAAATLGLTECQGVLL